MNDMNNGITLVLGGVGVRGIANIGVLQVLRDHQVPIKKIVTTGINSVIAAHYGLGRDLEELSERFARFFIDNDRYLWGMERLSGIPHNAVRRTVSSIDYFLRQRLFCEVNLKQVSILSREFVDERLQSLFGEASTDDLRIPLAVCAIELGGQSMVLLEAGQLIDLVRVGVSFPGVFPPAQVDGKEYISSILFCELPLDLMTAADRPIVAIDLPSPIDPHPPRTLLEIIARTDEVRSHAIKQRLLSRADTVVRLDALKKFSWGGYRHVNQLVTQARTAMEEKVNLVQTAGSINYPVD